MATAARRVELIYDVPAENERWLLEDEDVPESPLHDAIILLLVEILIAWRTRVQRPMLIGRNVALRWNAASPRQGVDPDVYVIEPPPPEGESASSICTWKPGHHPPRLAVEVVSESNSDKDYVDGPERYAASGTAELMGVRSFASWDRREGRTSYAAGLAARSPRRLSTCICR